MRVANDAVDSAFLIYLKYIDNYGFTIRFKLSFASFIQWGNVGFDDSKYCDWDLPLSVTSIFQVFVTDYDTSKTNGTSIGDTYTATYKPEFSDGSRLRFVTYSNSMGGFSAVAICR